MNEQQAVAEISRRGYTSAVVVFSGGNDEGGPDHIYYTLAEIDPGTEQPRRVDEIGDYWNGKDELVAWLAELPSQEYGSFAGEFEVQGTITVNPTAEKKVHWRVDEGHMSYSPREW